MKQNVNLLTLVLGLSLVIAATSCKKKSEKKNTMKNEIVAMVENGAKIFDVRTAAEFANGSYPNAVNIPVQDLTARISEFGDKNKPIVVFCASGARSSSAKTMLESAGYTNVKNAGGIRTMFQIMGQH